MGSVETLKVAAITVQSKLGCIEENLNKTRHWIEKASMIDAEIICFPELHLTGYACHKEIIQSAIHIESDIIKQLLKWAATYQILILAGFAELTSKGLLYATHGIFYPDGHLACYRKTHLSPPEQNLFSFGKHLPVFEYKHFKFGVQLCYDAHFPEISTKMTQKGIDLLFIPHASPNGTPEKKFHSWMRHLPARAFDNSIYVIAVNQCGENGNGLKFPGLGIFLSPSGHLIHSSKSITDSMASTTLTKEALDEVRGHRMRYFFPNRQLNLK